MRIALVVHGLPPHERTGVETHVDALAAALAGAGCEVALLAARRSRGLPHLAQRSERRGRVALTWLELCEPPRDVAEEAEPPGVAEAVGEWLDLAAPELVHVHHLRGLGWGVLAAVAARRLPLFYTAHDDHAVCHRVAHLRPDLSRCESLGDAAACARCDRAVELLHGVPELGDWHLGVEPERLAPPLRAELARRLAGDDGGHARALAERARADARRSAALAQVERVFAPTRRVLELLLASGLPRERVVLQPYGIPPLQVPPAQGAGRLRVGFFGGLSKHKGAQVLLEACAGLAGVELVLNGDSSDRVFVESLRARAAELGARWNGAYAAAELGARLAEVDLVAVPSLWVENAPFVIREAFAAGRPVLASDLGALPESVRDGVDGRLVPAGDAGAWRAVLAELAGDRAQLARLTAGTRAPRALADQADELIEHYQDALAAREAAQTAPALPEHLTAFQARRAALACEPFERLHARVRDGLARLRAGLGHAPSPTRAPDDALRRARDLLRDRRRESAWRARAAGDDRAARASLAAEAAWLRGLCESGADDLAGARAAREALAHESAWLRQVVAALERERDWLRGLLAALEARAGDHAALREHERWLRGEAVRLLEALEAAPTQAPADPAALAAALEHAPRRAAALRAELEWRRAQMQRALDEGGGVLATLLAPTPLAARLESWRAGAPEARA
jgi:glycosyltransferase involved in cell wall biosynthesis